MAGLWEQWIGPEQEMLESCTILTTSPNQLMERLHDRMPVILPQDQMSKWLEPSTSARELQAMTSPYPTEEMAAYPVSSLVNSPRNNGPECLERQEILEQEELF
jgi:putative SOS response-associated peptidase YedK